MNRHDLGIHTEQIGASMAHMIQSGVVTNRYKNLDRGWSVGAFIIADNFTYNYVNNHPRIMMRRGRYTNDPMIIAQQDNMVSINAALQVDLQGQVCAEAMGLKQFSGIGGQVDFIRGAAFSKGGRAILAFPATAKGGTISKIVPFLTEGSPVTTSRCDVDYIVTEYGIAKMKGRTLRERARQLIGLAAPQFRDDLAVEFEKRFAEKY